MEKKGKTKKRTLEMQQQITWTTLLLLLLNFAAKSGKLCLVNTRLPEHRVAPLAHPDTGSKWVIQAYSPAALEAVESQQQQLVQSLASRQMEASPHRWRGTSPHR